MCKTAAVSHARFALIRQKSVMNKSVALVTGASQGIGRATAIRLARDFSIIVLAARNRAALTEVADQVQRAGAEPFVCDLI